MAVQYLFICKGSIGLVGSLLTLYQYWFDCILLAGCSMSNEEIACHIFYDKPSSTAISTTSSSTTGY